MKREFSRAQRLTVIQAVLGLILIVVVLQLWLFAATLNAHLGGDDSVVWPAACAGVGCFALNALLLRCLYRVEAGSET